MQTALDTPDIQPDTLEAIQEAIRIELARNSLYGFVMYTKPDYLMGWVHEVICRELDDFLAASIRGESPRLMLTMPPRHGKTELASIRFPAYALGRYPHIGIISTSYSSTLTRRANKEIQRIIDSKEYGVIFPATKLGAKMSGYTRNSDEFEVVGNKGFFKGVGVGGGLTGFGATILQIDDPFKNRAEADSITIRENVWDWYTSSFYTRLAPGGGIIIINTRWHEDDLSGRLLQMSKDDMYADKWRVVNFKAIATEDEEHRKEGEALHPERYSVSLLNSIKTAVGSRDWSALYQQEPVPDGGAVFKREWLKYHHYTRNEHPNFDSVALSWDMAFKDTAGSDYVVGQVWGKKGPDLYLMDQVRGRMDFTATVKAFKMMCEAWKPAQAKYVEDKANGTAVINILQKEIPGIIPVTPDGGKVARSHAVTPYFESGNIYIPHHSIAPWVVDYETELLTFPSGKHDDQVDASTQAIGKMLQQWSVMDLFRSKEA